VIVSLLYKVARKLLSVPGVLLRSDTSKAAEVLVPRHGNAVLRRQIAGPVRYEPADRFWLAALSSLIPRRRRPALFPVTPGTLLAWHRKFTARRAMLKTCGSVWRKGAYLPDGSIDRSSSKADVAASVGKARPCLR
jgi:hypothetical protein